MAQLNFVPIVLTIALLDVSLTVSSAYAQSIFPTNADVLAPGGPGSVTVSASGAWTATSDDDWIQIVSPASGSGTANGTVSYNVNSLPDNTTNINHYARVGTLTIAGQNFTVVQHPGGQVIYDAWASVLPAGANGPEQDASGTGIPNIVKYALGLDPLKPSKGGLPGIAVTNGRATFSLTKPSAVVGVRYTVHSTDQLSVPASNILALTKISGISPAETWQVSVPATGGSEFLASSVVQVGVTAREVQKAINATLDTFTTNLSLWNIQPGLGTVMIEYGRRFAMMKKAADAGDWGTAQYQLTEATEIQETGETTRPAKAALLKSFEHAYLDPLAQDILAKDTINFATHFSDAIDGCNACHKITGHPYVSIQPPTNPPEALLDLAASNPISPGTTPPPAAITPAPDTPLTWPEVWQQIGDSLSTVDTRFALWRIQPGLGTVMMEYGRRFEMMKLAADAGDWGMAQYQLMEAIEIQETGETTRPAKRPLLKSFEHAYLDPLAEDILAKNANSFATHFSDAIDGCNACHKITGHPYVSVRTPVTSPEPFLLLAPSNPVTPATNAPFAPLTPAFGSGAPALADAQNLISNRLSSVDRNMALWNIQPGLGTVMQEYGFRFALAWFAAEAGNWDMAAYQITEALEIQETGETTRPANKPLLKNFEETYVTPLTAAIAAKDKAGFESAYSSAVGGCNACHTGTRHAYARFQIPPVMPADYLKMTP